MKIEGAGVGGTYSAFGLYRRRPDEAQDLAREYLPRFFRAAVKHYDVTNSPYRNSKAFAEHAKMSENFIKLSDPANLGPYMDVTFVGGAATVRQRVQDYLDCGFDNLMVQPSSPGIPEDLRRDWLRRFATEVAPEFSSRFSHVRRTA